MEKNKFCNFGRVLDNVELPTEKLEGKSQILWDAEPKTFDGQVLALPLCCFFFLDHAQGYANRKCLNMEDLQ